MADKSLTTVDFLGATLIARRGDTPTGALVAMKPVVEGTELDWESLRRGTAMALLSRNPQDYRGHFDDLHTSATVLALLADLLSETRDAEMELTNDGKSGLFTLLSECRDVALRAHAAGYEALQTNFSGEKDRHLQEILAEYRRGFAEGAASTKCASSPAAPGQEATASARSVFPEHDAVARTTLPFLTEPIGNQDDERLSRSA